MIIYAEIRQVCGHELRRTGKFVSYYAPGCNAPLSEELYACACGEFTLRDVGWIMMTPRPMTAAEIDEKILKLEGEIDALWAERRATRRRSGGNLAT